MRNDPRFGPADEQRILDAVRDAEAKSRGQIVPLVVAKSDAYPEARFRGGILGAGLVTLAVVFLFPSVTVLELPFLQVAGGILGALVAMWDPIERVLVGRKAMDEAVRARAQRAFFEEGLHRTREGTGVLVFASLFEHEAVVLGDHGIHGKMGDDWKQAVDKLVAGMRAGEPAAGFVEAIRYCGERLATHFPRAEGPHPNELEDELRRR